MSNEQTPLTGRRIYMYRCRACGDDPFEIMVRFPERDEQVCERCGETLHRMPTTFAANTRTSRSFIDGVDRGDTYRRCKEAGKIEAEMYNLPVEKRGEHKAEIRKLKEVKK